MIYCRGVARWFNAQCSNTGEENHFSEKKLLNLATKAKNFFCLHRELSTELETGAIFQAKLEENYYDDISMLPRRSTY